MQRGKGGGAGPGRGARLLQVFHLRAQRGSLLDSKKACHRVNGDAVWNLWADQWRQQHATCLAWHFSYLPVSFWPWGHCIVASVIGSVSLLVREEEAFHFLLLSYCFSTKHVAEAGWFWSARNCRSQTQPAVIIFNKSVFEGFKSTPCRLATVVIH